MQRKWVGVSGILNRSCAQIPADNIKLKTVGCNTAAQGSACRASGGGDSASSNCYLFRVNNQLRHDQRANAGYFCMLNILLHDSLTRVGQGADTCLWVVNHADAPVDTKAPGKLKTPAVESDFSFERWCQSPDKLRAKARATHCQRVSIDCIFAGYVGVPAWRAP